MKKSKFVFPLLFSSLMLISSCQQIDNVEASQSEDSKVLDTVHNVVDDKNFLSATVDDKAKFLDLRISDTEKPKKVEEKINKELKKKKITSYTINIVQEDINLAKKEHRWELFSFNLIDDLLSKPEYKGTTLTSDIKDVKQPVKLTINTPVTGIDLDAKEYAKKLEQNINDVIKIEKNKKLIVEDSYVIQIYNKDHQLIN
ncbi:DUF4030 domain-containing protein [Bacillus toyonensis]|uniref:DUF4030 domain-containing protein n=2 Tax=Bacillus toyonensis TaxID=155322 RepID=UPI000B44DEA1|nr:DUF4030 domain-containing protein [Bacillus toyonensis]OTW81027.1 hypothetical protein BK702_26285 [Bacillus thuringiensis serovar cameroun]PEK39212.1 DUF4030 domain-containing protein [Bacillus toyonensis]PHE81876.1 DUF4030 domain-containing protein [Bacillus toyonensis]